MAVPRVAGKDSEAAANAGRQPGLNRARTGPAIGGSLGPPSTALSKTSWRWWTKAMTSALNSGAKDRRGRGDFLSIVSMMGHPFREPVAWMTSRKEAERHQRPPQYLCRFGVTATAPLYTPAE